MSLAVLKSRALAGMDAQEVNVEVHLANGLPGFTIVGLADTEVKEAKDRVRAAIQNGGFEFPAKRITVNLAPADLPKESGRFDLPIALGILAASKQIPSSRLHQYEFAGELSLSGELRPIRGALAMSLATRRDGGRLAFILPHANADEAALVADAAIYPAKSLLQVCAHFAAKSAESMLSRHESSPLIVPAAATSNARLTKIWPLTSAKSGYSAGTISGDDSWRDNMDSADLAAKCAHTCSSDFAG